MLKVLTAAQMREVDRLTTERYGIPSLLLMENAAHAVAHVITDKLGGSVNGKSILILCGKGNNGGDGAALARILFMLGADVLVCLLGRIAETKGDANANFEIVKKLAQSDFDRLSSERDIAYIECSTDEEWAEFLDQYFHFSDPEIIVDALLGTGLTKPLAGLYESVAQWVRAFNVEGVPQNTLVFSIDLPSGLDADGVSWIGQSIRAHVTITFTAPKQANIIPPICDWSGELHVATIGSPKELIDAQLSQLFLAEPQDAKKWLEKTSFTDDSYKNKRGHALLIAGSKDYTGAAVLAGDAAMRSGVGLVTLAVPESSRESVVARVMPEVMVRGISETADGSASEKAVDDVKAFLKNVDAVAIGSGLSSKEDETKEFVRRIVEERKTPVVIDADGLTALSPWNKKGSTQAAGGTPAVQSPLVLTPHEGEFMRLLGTDDKEAIKDRVAAVRDFATKHHAILVLKGERVLIGEPGGKVVVNPTGNSGLGKAGNGDTLTGILVAFVAQARQMKIDIFETVVAAVYVAGMAGDIAEKKYGKRVMTASDVRECLSETFASLESKG